MSKSYTPRTTAQIAQRVVQDIPDGAYVNLGIGQPMSISNHLPPDKEIILQSENGVLGMGPVATGDDIDPELVNAGKQNITLLKGGAIFHHGDSFAMIRGGHINLAILGAMQVSAEGDLANWMIPGKMVKGMGGAMDLVAGVKRVIILMEHVARRKDGGFDLKILPECSLPLTGVGVVNRIITDMAVMDVTPEGLKLVELAPDVTRAQVQERTGVTLV